MGNVNNSSHPREERQLRPQAEASLINCARVSSKYRPDKSEQCLIKITSDIHSPAPTHVYYPVEFVNDFQDNRLLLPPHMINYLCLEPTKEYSADVVIRNRVLSTFAQHLQIEIQKIDPAPHQMWEVDRDAFIQQFSATFRNYPFSPGQTVIMNYEDKVLTLVVETIGPQSENVIYNVRPDSLISPLIGKVTNLKWLEIFINKTLPATLEAADPELGGYDNEFQKIINLLLPRSLPDTAKRFGIKAPKAVLLYGPPGTGKGSIVKAITNHVPESRVKIVNGPEIMDRFIGNSEANVRNLFKDAEDALIENPSNKELFFIVFDEIDAIAAKRTSQSEGANTSNRVVTQLTTYIDGLVERPNIFIFAMTNRRDDLDPAILRRFDDQVEVGLPNEEYRAKILRVMTKLMRKNDLLDANVDLTYWARKLEGFTPAEIRLLVDKVGRKVFRKEFFELSQNSKELRPKTDIKLIEEKIKIKNTEFEEVFATITPAFGVDRSQFNFEASKFADYNFLAAKTKRFQDARDDLYASQNQKQLNILISGENGTGKSEFSKYLATQSGANNIVRITAKDLIGLHVNDKIKFINERFQHVLETDRGVLIIDGIDSILKSEVNREMLKIQFEHMLILDRDTKHKCIILMTTADELTTLDFDFNNLFHEVYELNSFDIKSREDAINIIKPLCEVLGFKFSADKDSKTDFILDVSIAVLRQWIDRYCMHNNNILELDKFKKFIDERMSFKEQYINHGFLNNSNTTNDIRRTMTLVSK